jgi:hypothetical protein
LREEKQKYESLLKPIIQEQNYQKIKDEQLAKEMQKDE